MADWFRGGDRGKNLIILFLVFLFGVTFMFHFTFKKPEVKTVVVKETVEVEKIIEKEVPSETVVVYRDRISETKEASTKTHEILTDEEFVDQVILDDYNRQKQAILDGKMKGSRILVSENIDHTELIEGGQ